MAIVVPNAVSRVEESRIQTRFIDADESATDANTPQTLAEYLKYAALHNAGLKAVFEEWKAALEQIPQAKALPDPKFTYERN